MKKWRGFTLVELMIAIAIIVILATIITLYLFKQRSNSKLARVTEELTTMSTALSQYAEDNNYVYPADVDRGLPPGLEKYLAGGQWPISVWPHGVFDYDNWQRTDSGANYGKQVYQISYRLCGLSDPVSYCQDPVLFPTFTQKSSIFYCISGPCVPHRDAPFDPGYCVNCNPKKQNY